MYLILRPKAKLADSVKCFKEAGIAALGCGLIDTVSLYHTNHSTHADSASLNNAAICKTSISKVREALVTLAPELTIVTSTVAADIYIESIHCAATDTQSNTFIAVGASTAKHLLNKQAKVLQAEPSNSEGVLARVKQLKLTGGNVAILKGRGGRKLINEALTEKGFTVTEFDLYERVVLKEAYYTDHFEPDAIQCIIATSTEIIDAAYNLFESNWLNDCQWIVVSKRTKQHLSALGAKHIFTSNGATDSNLIAAANQVKGSQHE